MIGGAFQTIEKRDKNLEEKGEIMKEKKGAKKAQMKKKNLEKG